MKDKVNSYFATIILLIAGVSAVWIIMHIATKKTTDTAVPGSAATYDQLQQSILNQ